MRSKRSKAWHRRKDEIAQVRRLIEQGVPRPSYQAELNDIWRRLMDNMMLTRSRIIDDVLSNRFRGKSILEDWVAPADDKPPTIKFRRYTP